MEQRFIDGDNLSLKEYFLNWRDLVRFYKLGKWFIFCSLKTIAIFVPLFLFMTLAGLLAGTLPKDITEILRFFSYIISGGLIVVWCISFFHFSVDHKTTGFGICQEIYPGGRGSDAI